MPLGFANVRSKKPFCPLVVAIGVEPETVVFEDVKAVARVRQDQHPRQGRLRRHRCSCVGIHVPLRSWTQAPISRPRARRARHRVPAPVRIYPRHRRGAPQAAQVRGLSRHVAHPRRRRRNPSSNRCPRRAPPSTPPPPMFPDDKGLSVQATATNRHREEIIALGYKAYRLGMKRIQTEVGNLLQGIKLSRRRGGGPRDCRVGWTVAR